MIDFFLNTNLPLLVAHEKGFGSFSILHFEKGKNKLKEKGKNSPKWNNHFCTKIR